MISLDAEMSAPGRPHSIGDQIVSTKLYSTPGAYHKLFDQVRRESPVVWVEPEGFAPFWVVSKHADIQEVELAKDIFINAPRSMLRSRAVEDQVRAATGGRPLLLRHLANMDGEVHMNHRLLTQGWFMPNRLKALDGALRGYAREYIDTALANGGECDFVRDVASWYPLRVIMHILGVPESDEPLMLRLTQQIFGPDDPDVKTETNTDVVATVRSFFDYFRNLTAERRQSPRDDIATIIAQAQIDGQPIGELEALSYYILVATAGHDTTSSTLAGGLLALIQHPDQLARLRDQPELFGGAIEEMLRWVSPVTHFFRTSTQDYELRGRQIRAGESLMMCYPSANRDEDVFEDPYRFDITRSAGRQLTFGFGPHVCLGQHLAKLELRVFFEELLRQIESVELIDEPKWVESNFVGGLKRLPVRFSVAT
ncbi:MAG TPA: cytochrome P450 [Phenylobacterium sp.]|uniref:cytochrome P450 n=1 Tax=Phenylobacterium sp. TaxID=1871053 RepID=UPI002B45FBA2|nr:cytochrome P450 [Phenylobacterium sp.]HKR89626.1 cytochrome P450 [Phenylobacterium sp.]